MAHALAWAGRKLKHAPHHFPARQARQPATVDSGTARLNFSVRNGKRWNPRDQLWKKPINILSVGETAESNLVLIKKESYTILTNTRSKSVLRTLHFDNIPNLFQPFCSLHSIEGRLNAGLQGRVLNSPQVLRESCAKN